MFVLVQFLSKLRLVLTANTKVRPLDTRLGRSHTVAHDDVWPDAGDGRHL